MATQVKVEIFKVHPEHRIVECTHCKAKQNVYVTARTGAAQMAAHSIACIRCKRHFVVMVPHNIVGGPFPL